MEVLVLMAMAGLLGLLIGWPAWFALGLLAGALGLLWLGIAARFIDLLLGLK